jgi:hypothetical protein
MQEQPKWNTQEQPIRHMQEPNGHIKLIKLAFIVMAFGAISYIWFKTSRELMNEIEKGWNDNQRVMKNK